DIEAWPLNPGGNVTKQVAKANLARIIQIIGWARQTHPNLKIGFYSLPQPTYDMDDPNAIPQLQKATDFWRGIDPDTGAYDPSSDLIGHLDFLSPSLYVRQLDVHSWQRVATAIMDEAHRVATLYPTPKPVYPFLYPDYEGKLIDPVTNTNQIRPDYW